MRFHVMLLATHCILLPPPQSRVTCRKVVNGNCRHPSLLGVVVPLTAPHLFEGLRGTRVKNPLSGSSKKGEGERAHAREAELWLNLELATPLSGKTPRHLVPPSCCCGLQDAGCLEAGLCSCGMSVDAPIHTMNLALYAYPHLPEAGRGRAWLNK